ncbi:MAG: hypothetical protein NTY74_14325 [Ignavibacteriae bacterium]|nr:hypothetical protein [Ignavibacteriota bacterium]
MSISLIADNLGIKYVEAYKLVNSVSILHSKEGIKRIILYKYPRRRKLEETSELVFKSRRSFLSKHLTHMIMMVSFLISFLLFWDVTELIDDKESNLIGLLFIVVYIIFAFVLEKILGPWHEDHRIKKENKWGRKELFS